MEFLNLKARGLAGLLFLALMACGKAQFPDESGKLTPVKIRAVTIAGGSQAANSFSLDVATAGNFNLADGEFSGSGSINFPGWPDGTISKTDRREA